MWAGRTCRSLAQASELRASRGGRGIAPVAADLGRFDTHAMQVADGVAGIHPDRASERVLIGSICCLSRGTRRAVASATVNDPVLAEHTLQAARCPQSVVNAMATSGAVLRQHGPSTCETLNKLSRAGDRIAAVLLRSQHFPCISFCDVQKIEVDTFLLGFPCRVERSPALGMVRVKRCRFGVAVVIKATRPSVTNT